VYADYSKICKLRMGIDPELLLRAYAAGIFPMSDARDDPDIFWVEPKRRAILPLDGLNISHSLAKTVRQNRFTVTSDKAFTDVIRLCAAPTPGRDDTWINAGIEQAFIDLHQQGRAHSVECWLDDKGERKLVGGLYGLALGGAFFGESMFSRASDASKTALVWLVARLRIGGFQLLDCQFMTEHLGGLGAIEISQKRYLGLLASALAENPDDYSSMTVSSATGSSGSSTGSGSAVRSARAGRGADWSSLDGFLAAGAVAAAVDSVPSVAGAASSTASSSPGKLILHSFTQIS
jgi:leucyl/phenylalanyl-tRNA---protein transferase